ncbi:hypothetical protein EHP00_823 [Ecytonucleospora hepatopenaei]|uniref:Protein PBN1 n=1 Tax=Ecytonucleospora hepatopenaei TaxID=646526 RepID=A0A1W0E882_9MICR|nr:hypothetical protein EHP00_823 [Ecytonucleospora hepatopenaei]
MKIFTLFLFVFNKTYADSFLMKIPQITNICLINHKNSTEVLFETTNISDKHRNKLVPLIFFYKDDIPRKIRFYFPHGNSEEENKNTKEEIKKMLESKNLHVRDYHEEHYKPIINTPLSFQIDIGEFKVEKNFHVEFSLFYEDTLLFYPAKFTKYDFIKQNETDIKWEFIVGIFSLVLFSAGWFICCINIHKKYTNNN